MKQCKQTAQKSENGVGAAAVCGETKRMESLPGEANVFTAEVYTIKLAISIVNEKKVQRAVIYSDSYSALVKFT